MDYMALAVPERTSTIEEWRPVLGFEGVYEVSNYGSIRRILLVPRSKTNPKPTIDGAGYRQIALHHNGKQKTVRVHQVVYEAFNGPVTKGLVINHKDGKKANPRLDNLEAVTQQENIDHAVRTGLFNQSGTLNHQAKLTDSSVSIIRAIHRRGKFGYCKLAKMFKVSPGTIRDILAGKAWADSRHEPPAPVHILQAIADVAWEKRLKPKRRRPRDPKRSKDYLRWIRCQPCAVCGITTGIESHHTGPHGLSEKASDFNAIPLCGEHHRTGSNAYHKLGPVKFQQLHNISFADLIAYFQGMYGK